MNPHRGYNRKVVKRLLMRSHSKKESQSQKILDYISQEKVVTTSELAKFLKVSWNTAEKNLLELTLDGKVERFKKQGVNIWLLKDE